MISKRVEQTHLCSASTFGKFMPDGEARRVLSPLLTQPNLVLTLSRFTDAANTANCFQCCTYGIASLTLFNLHVSFYSSVEVVSLLRKLGRNYRFLP